VHRSPFRYGRALRLCALLAAVPVILWTSSATAQNKSTRNLTVVHDLAVPAVVVEADQAADRPFAYAVADSRDRFVVVDLDSGEKLSTWSVPTESGSVLDIAIAEWGERDYVIALLSKRVAIVDVTDATKPQLLRVVAEGGESNAGSAFAYRHSSGGGIVAIARGKEIRLLDLPALLAGDVIGASISTPEQLERGSSGFDTVYLEYHLPSGQDRLYGAGSGGYHVFDVSNPGAPGLIASVNPATVGRGRVAAPTPDGRYLVATAENEWSPVQLYDLQPIFSGETGTVRTSESAWTPNWKGYTRAVTVRWPLAFAASSGDGLQVFNLRDPADLFTVGYIETGKTGDASSGAYDVDFRNVDGRIVVADSKLGVLVVQLDEMRFWDGHGFGMPNNSSAQDWDSGPDMVGPE